MCATSSSTRNASHLHRRQRQPCRGNERLHVVRGGPHQPPEARQAVQPTASQPLHVCLQCGRAPVTPESLTFSCL